MPAGRSRDWISDYVILTNAHNRMGEGDFYLVTKFKNLPVAAEAESATRAFRAQMQRTDQQLAAERRQRATYRNVLGSMLLQEMHLRN